MGLVGNLQPGLPLSCLPSKEFLGKRLLGSRSLLGERLLGSHCTTRLPPVHNVNTLDKIPCSFQDLLNMDILCRTITQCLQTHISYIMIF